MHHYFHQIRAYTIGLKASRGFSKTEHSWKTASIKKFLKL